MQNILIVGGGFAGVWSAISAVAAREQLGLDATELRITLASRDPYLTIRPRLYESQPDRMRVPFDDVFAEAGVEVVVGEVTTIDASARTVTARTVTARNEQGELSLTYDRLILAAGSRLRRPNIPGAAEHAYSVDTLQEAVALEHHLRALPNRTTRAGRFTAVVVGAGFTGLEVATELVTRLRAVASQDGALNEVRVVLVERQKAVGLDFSAEARMSIDTALHELGIELRLETSVAAVTSDGVWLDSGEWIAAATTLWTGGLSASPLGAQLGAERDDLGRLPVDEYLRVRGVRAVLAAGDIAHAMADAEHVAPMSCQLAIPMGEVAGRNAVFDLLGAPLTAFSWPHYVTCLDLGAWGALFTDGWDRRVRLEGFWAKVLKQTINQRLIYPPVDRTLMMRSQATRLDVVRAA